MNQIYDQFLIRGLFALSFALTLYLYKYFHILLYPSSKQQILTPFVVEINAADTIHFFSRLMGFAIIFSQFNFVIQESILLSLLDFFVKSFFSITFYLISCFILESLVLYNFTYDDEIVKKRNLAYAIISMTHSISAAYLINVIFTLSINSIPFLSILWMTTIIILGLISMSFKLYSNQSIETHIYKKDVTGSIAYVGYMAGAIAILASSLDHSIDNIQWYLVQFILKTLLSAIFLPIIFKVINIVLNVKLKLIRSQKNETEQLMAVNIYEAILFFTACLFVVVITNQITFNNIYN